MTSGCAWFRPREVQAPPEIAAWPGLEQIRSGVISRESLSRAFEPISHFILISRVIAQQNRFFGKFRFDLYMVAKGSTAARIRGQHPGDQTTLFDLLALEDELKIYVDPQKTFFEGTIPAEGSPFLRRFGVEPWELSGIATIGQRLSESEFEVAEKRRAFRLELDDRATTDGLVSVHIDRATGLPSEAIWKRGKRQWEVEYHAWDVFDGNWLMPTEFLIKSKRPRGRIEVRPNPSSQTPQYRINPEGVGERQFQLEPRSGAQRGTLQDFDRVLN